MNNQVDEAAELPERIELLPCPFCEGKAVRGMFNVWCNNCQAGTVADSSATRERVIAAWNTRATVGTAPGAELLALLDRVEGYWNEYPWPIVTVRRIREDLPRLSRELRARLGSKETSK